MAVKNPKSTQYNPTSGKRPYAIDKAGYVQKMKAVPDRAVEYMVKEFQGFVKQSEFKKPYKAPSYDEMEYTQKQWPSIPPNPIPPPGPIPPPPPPPDPPGPPGPPGPSPGPWPLPPRPDPTYKTYRCGILDFFFCPNGPPVTVQMGHYYDADTGVRMELFGDGSLSKGGGDTWIYTPGGGCTAWVYGFTAHGATCGGSGYCKDPALCEGCTGTGSIGYTTTQMNVGETQQLTATCGVGPGGSCNATWSVSGGGSITSGGLYTAPSSNANCANNPTISLSCGGTVVATLTLAVNAVTGGAGYYRAAGQFYSGRASGQCFCRQQLGNFGCNGVESPASYFDCNTNFNQECTVAEMDAIIAALCAASTAACSPYIDNRTAAQLLNGCCPAQLI